MVASVGNSVFLEHLSGRFLSRLGEAARLVSADFSANRFRLRELLDDLAFELDAGDLAIRTLGGSRYGDSTGTQINPRAELPASTC